MYSDWADVEAAVESLVTRSKRAFAPETLLNARALMRTSQARYQTPAEVGDGYWPTIGFHWPDLKPDPIEVEVHSGRFELYVFGRGGPDIRSFDSLPGANAPADLLAALDGLLSSPRAQ